MTVDSRWDPNPAHWDPPTRDRNLDLAAKWGLVGVFLVLVSIEVWLFAGVYR